MQTLTVTDRALDLGYRLEKAGITEEQVRAFSRKEALAVCAGYRGRAGFSAVPAPLLGQNHKLELSDGTKVFTKGLSLLPHTLSGYNTCRWSGACALTCLEGAGQGGLSDMPTRARGWRTAMLAEAPAAFFRLLLDELEALSRKAIRLGRRWKVACRLNVFSDLRWELIVPWLLALCRDGFGRGRRARVWMYDYTKGRGHRDVTLCDSLGYDLSFSVDERTPLATIPGLRRPVVVFACKKGHLPTTWMGMPVINGDETDARFLEPTNVVVGLSYKRVTRQGAGKLSDQLAEAARLGFAVVPS